MGTTVAKQDFKTNESTSQEEIDKMHASFAKKVEKARETLKKYPIPFDTVRK